jgi:hypothetical protein
MTKKESGKWHSKTGIGMICMLVFIAMVVTSINACGFLGIFGEASWKEEVLLHDSSKIIVKRWQKLKGWHEIGQKPPVGEQSIKFTLPGTKKTITWRDEYNSNIGMSNYKVLSLHILNATPYIITSPHGCFSYNLSGRPNPPYVVFKYENDTWKRIELAELPIEFKNINLVITTIADEQKLKSQSVVSAKLVKEINGELTQEEYKTIIRTPIKIWCEEEVTDGKGNWYGIDWFTSQSTYGACLAVCNQKKISSEYCPCSRFFKTNMKEK